LYPSVKYERGEREKERDALLEAAVSNLEGVGCWYKCVRAFMLTPV
jgi:hypothetical protein